MKFNTHHFPQGTEFRLRSMFKSMSNNDGRIDFTARAVARNGVKSWVIKTGVFVEFGERMAPVELSFNISHVEAITKAGHGPLVLDNGYWGGRIDKEVLLQDLRNADCSSLLKEAGLRVRTGYFNTISPRAAIAYEAGRVLKDSDLVDYERLIQAVINQTWVQVVNIRNPWFRRVLCINRKRLRMFMERNINRFLTDLSKAAAIEERQNEEDWARAMDDLDDAFDKLSASSQDDNDEEPGFDTEHRPTVEEVNGLGEADPPTKSRYHGFTCPQCGSHYFGTGRYLSVMGDKYEHNTQVGYCQAWQHEPSDCRYEWNRDNKEQEAACMYQQTAEEWAAEWEKTRNMFKASNTGAAEIVSETETKATDRSACKAYTPEYEAGRQGFRDGLPLRDGHGAWNDGWKDQQHYGDAVIDTSKAPTVKRVRRVRQVQEGT